MKYDVLGFVAHQGNNDVLTEEIDRQEYERVKKVKADCFFSLQVEEKFALLFDNYSEFEFELLRLAECGLIWRDRKRDHADAMRERLLLDNPAAVLDRIPVGTSAG